MTATKPERTTTPNQFNPDVFPWFEGTWSAISGSFHSVGGLTLRDLFALVYLHGRSNRGHIHDGPGVAKDAYTMADAMLAHRQK